MKLINGDCLQVMPMLPADSMDTIITDPPYGLSFMGKEWDHGVPGQPFWEAALRVAKPGAMLLAFGGTRTYHRLTCAIEDAGWEIRDCLMWLYGSGFPKSMDISKAIDKAAGAEIIGVDAKKAATDAAKLWDGWGTALKPGWEPIILAMKPLDGTFAANAQEHGVAGLNIDRCRIASEGGKHREGEASQDKRYTKSGGTNFAMKPGPRGGDPSGRFPANLILDEAAGQLLDEQSGIRKSGTGAVKRSTGTGHQGVAYGKESRPVGKAMVEYGDTGGASRFFYCAKAAKGEKGKDNGHPTVKPIKLMEYLCTLTATPTGGIVLDPFMGSGSTGVAAKNTGRDFIGIEKEQEFYEIATRRVA